MTAPVARRGFTDEAVAELLAGRDEPEWMRERRLEAWKTYQQIPMPTRQDEEWRRTDLRGLRLDEVAPYAEGDTGTGTLLPAAERDERYGGFLALRDGHVVERRLDSDLARRGVIFTDLGTAVREHGELLRRHFMTECVPAADSKFAALHGAFWQNGVFLYVPRAVTVEMPLRAVVAAGLDGVSSLAHTLIILEQNALATYAESFQSPEAGQQGFSTRIVELILGQAANLRYTGVQHWGRR